MFDDTTIVAVGVIATRLNVPLAALLAAVEVESGGRAFARVAGRLEPLIRFEGHYFDRHLSGKKREAARRAGLASPKAGAVKNPRSQSARWILLERAARIDRAAAYCAISWGVGQVMGSHWKWLGYGSVEAMVAQIRSGLEGQVEVMARFIERSGLDEEMRRQDWAGFARRYNGSAYKRNRYDTRIAAAYERWKERLSDDGLPVPVAPGDATLGFGSRGDEVLALQKALRREGHFLKLDGIFGLKTDAALRAFQKRAGLPETGRVAEFEARLLNLTLKTKPSPWLVQLGEGIGRLLHAIFQRTS